MNASDWPRLDADATCTPDRFRKYEIDPVHLLTKLSPNVDSGRFFQRDRIATAEDNGSTPTQGFRPCSRNVKAPVTHTKGACGVTGGFVEGATPDARCTEWGRDDVLTSRRTPGSRKSRRAAAKRA